MAMLIACTSAPRLQDYATLPPPDQVQAKLARAHIEISWDMPALPAASDISAFHVYLSERTLIYTPMAELPAPAQICSARVRRARIAAPTSATTVFIHVRSANKRGDLSLPSLPEIKMQLP